MPLVTMLRTSTSSIRTLRAEAQESGQNVIAAQADLRDF